jgi:uncharacterized membrane protein YbaN (DUF454 family)
MGQRHMSRVREVAGIALLIVGAIGLLLPVMPGVPFVIAAVALLGHDHPLVRSMNRRLRQWRGRLSRKWRSVS